MIRAQATNRQKNSRSSNKAHWKTWVKFIKQFDVKAHSCLERGASAGGRYIVCLVYGYISGTLGHQAFVSFGVSTLNSRTRRCVMYWTPPKLAVAKSNIQWEAPLFYTRYSRTRCHSIPVSLYDLWESWEIKWPVHCCGGQCLGTFFLVTADKHGVSVPPC